MSRALAMCAAGGVLVAAGLGVSTWGSQLVFEDLDRAQGTVEPGQRVSAYKAMEAGQRGVYAVEVPELGSVRAVLSGPDGEISDRRHGNGASEGSFEAGRDGRYVLDVYNEDSEAGFVAGYIGPEPDAGKMTVAFVSIYVLLAGVGMLAGGVVYALLSRRKLS